MSSLPRAFALALTLPVIALFVLMVRAVAVPILIAGLLAIILAPLTARIARRLGKRAGAAPAVVTIGTLVVLLAPAAVIAVLTFQQLRGAKSSAFAASISQAVGAGIRFFQRSFGWLSRVGIDMSAESLRGNVEEWVQGVLAKLGEYAGEALTAAPDLVVACFLFVISLYFWLRDGDGFLAWLRRILPFPAEDLDQLFQKASDAARGVMVAQLLTGAIQAGLALAFLFALSVPGAFLWGILAFVLSFIPLFGTTPVTLGAALYLFSQGRTVAGIVMLVGLVIIGAADNVVRPLVAAGDGRSHPLLSLVAIFGGLASIGASGIFLGPVIAALAVWSLEVFGRAKLNEPAQP